MDAPTEYLSAMLAATKSLVSWGFERVVCWTRQGSYITTLSYAIRIQPMTYESDIRAPHDRMGSTAQ